jgi:hypothetical protein
MRVIKVTQFGPEVLEVGEADEPAAGPGQSGGCQAAYRANHGRSCRGADQAGHWTDLPVGAGHRGARGHRAPRRHRKTLLEI